MILRPTLFLFFFAFLAFSVHADDTYSQAALREINRMRAAAGLGALQEDAAATAMSQQWSQHLAQIQKLEHRSRASLTEFLGKNHWSGLNENLHFSAQGGDPAFVVNSWMHSPHHKDNLLMPRITVGGVGLTKGTDGYYYVVFNGARPAGN